MYHKYHVITTSCPKCGKVLKTENELTGVLLAIITAFIYPICIWCASIIQKIFKYDLEKIGNPIKTCPKCGTLVNMRDRKEWEELTLLQKKSWAFRRSIRLCIFLSVVVLFCWLIALIPILVGEFEPSILILILSPVILILFINYIYNKWTISLKNEEIVVHLSDYNIIKESWNRLQKNNQITETSKLKIKETSEIITDFQCSLKDLIQKHFPLLSSQTVEILSNIISNTVNKYNLDNETKHKTTNVAEVFFYNFGSEINNYITSGDVQNGYFGIITILIVCCIMLSDKAYSRLKKSQTLWSDVKSCFQDNISDNLKNSFLKTMDYCYLMWHLDKISNGESIENLDNQLDGEELFTISVATFSQENKLTLKTDIA